MRRRQRQNSDAVLSVLAVIPLPLRFRVILNFLSNFRKLLQMDDNSNGFVR